MTTEPVTWERDDHTEAKHALLVAFFNKWVSIHSEYFAKLGSGLVRVYDGFAGPGVYTGGESGSPLILLRALCTNPRLYERWTGVRYELHFVEKDRRRAAMLQGKLEEFESAMRDRGPGWTDRVRWTVTCGRYEDNVPQTATGESALFLFLDPFGYSHAPMSLTQDLIQQPKSDTMIFLPLSFVNRFAGREGQERALDRFFGSPAWRDVPDGPERPQALLELFQAQLRKAGLQWVLPFRLKPEERGNAYWIVGGSAHLSGFASIKEGFWTVDPINGQGFAAPRSVPRGQETLAFEEPPALDANTEPLLVLLREHFGRQAFTVEDAIEATRRSRFLDTHLKTRTLAVAERANQLRVERPAGARQFRRARESPCGSSDRPNSVGTYVRMTRGIGGQKGEAHRMARTSSIEWTEATWNPVTGCSEVSPGCAHCYAKVFAERWRGVPGHPYEQGFDLRLWPERLETPLQWRKPKTIFVNSMSDLFHEDIPLSFVERIFETMRAAQWHTFQILTKRHERLADLADHFEWPPNVWMGVTIENRRFVHRADALRRVPSAVRFISAEPLLGPLDGLDLHDIDWLIAGGESGPGHRRVDSDWILDLRDACRAEDVAFFFKQWGGHRPKSNGRVLEGRHWDEYPTAMNRQKARIQTYA